MTCSDAVRLLDAYVDGELETPQRAEFHTHIEQCSRCGHAVDRRVALQVAVRALPYYSAPDRLRAALSGKARVTRRARRLPLAAAAVVVLGVAVGAALQQVRERRTTETLAASVAANHVLALQTSHVMDVRSSDQHTVKPWFLGRIDFAPPVNDLAASGFPLAGGRVATIHGRTVAALVYQRRLHPISVFVWPQSDLRALSTDVEQVRGFNVRHWTSDGMSFWAVTDANAADLEALELAMGR